jgi:WD40 repeat protein
MAAATPQPIPQPRAHAAAHHFAAPWVTAAVGDADDSSTLARGFVAAGADLCVTLTPVAIFRDTQPLRSVAFNPSELLPPPGVPLLSAGSNSKTLSLLEGVGVAPTTDEDAETGLATLPLVHQWQGHHAGSVFCTAWAPLADGHGTSLLATGSNDTTVKVVSWPPHADWPAAMTLHTDAGTVRDVCWLGSGERALQLVAGGAGDFGVRLWDVSTLRGPSVHSSAAHRLMGHTDVVHGVRAAGGDGRTLVSCSADGTVRVWDVRSRTAVQIFCPTAPSSGSGDAGRMLQAGAALATRAVTGGAALHTLAVRGAPDALCASGGAMGTAGREVVVGTLDGEVAVLDLAAGRMVASARLHTDEVRCVDAMGPLLLSASFDGSVAVSAVTAGTGAQAATLAPLTVRRDHRDRVLSARWHPHQPLLATSSADRTVLLWRVDAYRG